MTKELIMKTENKVEFDNFLTAWQDSQDQTKKAFIELLDHLRSMGDISLDFKARPGVSFSLRPKHNNQKKRELFVMLDVIDDDPLARWLSICFYGDMITDPDEMGDLIPEGLLGEDGYCFDIDEDDKSAVDYIKVRLNEAYQCAKL